METLEQVKENGKEVKSNPQLCAEEVDAVLTKYGCRFISTQQDYYGQPVWVPSIVEIKKP